jgi:purine nucleosidase
MKISQTKYVLVFLFCVAPAFIACLRADGQGAALPAASTAQLAILDTDIGDDIDDAFALALLFDTDETYLLGITTTYGDTDLRVRLVDRYLEALCLGGEEGIPVVPGLPTLHQNVFTQSAYARQELRACRRSIPPGNLGDRWRDWPLWDAERKHHDAAGFILWQASRYPGKVTLIAIGPLNNIEAAIQRDPVTFKKLKRVVMMGGSIYRGYGPEGVAPIPEWNISRDPAGARALLASGVPVYMMPLDSTQIPLEEVERERIFSHGSPLTDQLTLLYHQWKANAPGHAETPTLFDPVAVAYAVKPELCPVTPLRLEVDDKGFTKPVPGAPNAQVCLKSDEKGFLELLLGRITGDAAR